MATIVYNEAKYFLTTGKLNLSTDILKVMLLTPTYVPSPNQKFVDDGTLLAPNQFESAGTGYIGGFGGTGRKLITGKLLVRDEQSFRIRLFGDNILWNPINVGPIGGLLVIREGVSLDSTDRDSLIIGYTNEGGFPIPTDGGELQVRWNVNGILAF